MPTLTTHMSTETEDVEYHEETYEVVIYNFWVTIGKDGPILFTQRYVDKRDLDVAPTGIQYSMVYNQKVDHETHAQAVFEETIAYFFKKIFV